MRERLRASAWLWAPLLVALAMRTVFYVGLYAGDDLHYAERAAELLRGEARLERDFQSLRHGLILPTAAGLALFRAPVLATLIASLGCVAMAAALARRAAGDAAGLAGGLVLAVTPLAVTHASKIAPEPMAGLLMACAALLYLRALEENERRPHAWAAAAGLACGMSHFVKESAFFFIAFCALEAAVRRRWRPLLVTTGVFAAVGLVECLTYLALTGDFLFRVRAVRGANFAQFVQGDDAAWWQPFRMLAHKRYALGVHLLALASAGVWLARRRDGRASPFLRWCAVGFLLTAFWPAGLSPPRRAIPVDPRFYEPLLLPSAVAIGVAAHALRGWKLVATLGIAAPLLLACNAVTHRNSKLRAHAAEATHAYIAAQPPRPVVTDGTMLLAHRFLSGYREGAPIATSPAPEWDEYWLVLADDEFEQHARDAKRAWILQAIAWRDASRAEEVFRTEAPRSVDFRTLFKPRAPRPDDPVTRIYLCRRR